MAAFLRRLRRTWFFWFAHVVFRLFARTVYGLHVHHSERVPRHGPFVLAVNHFSAWDPPVVGVCVPREISFMAKKELFESPFKALLFRGLRAFPVDRRRNDLGAVKEALRRLADGQAIGIFVQGTRDAERAEALDGAAFLAVRAGAPVLPTAIWREGRRFHVRFGEPFRVEGRGRPAIRAGTEQAVRRMLALLPADKRPRAALEGVLDEVSSTSLSEPEMAGAVPEPRESEGA